jgi:hypothetical protein
MVPVKSVTVLLYASRAVILMLKAVPAVCGAMSPPIEASTKKLFSTPALTVREELATPISDPSVAVIVAVSAFVRVVDTDVA